jgi:hypothetical protein
MKVVMGMIVRNRFNEMKRTLYHNSRFFDRMIVVSDSSEPEMNEWLVSEEAKQLGVYAILDFDGYQTIRLRNRYLEEAAKEGWMMRLDVDECISFEGGTHLRQIAEEAEANGVNIVSFKSCDIVENLDGSTRLDNPDFWCPNFFKLTPNITYMGKHHEGINLGVPHANANVVFKYYHIRSEASVYLRGCRNAFAVAETAGGIGDVRVWSDLRGRCSAAGIEEFAQLEKLLRAGTVPEEVEQWFLDQRDAENSEYRAFFGTYHVLLHPDKNTEQLTNRDFPTHDPNREPYTREMSC